MSCSTSNARACTCLRRCAKRHPGTLEYCVAGHLPILRVGRDGRVYEHTTPQIPLGVFPDQRFVSAQLECAPGELIAIVTDGLTEVFDRSDQEFGLDQLKTVIAADRDAPLERIAELVVARVREHGPQIDDQTLLLIRRVLA
jgi:sigma-B regulation protein RsbU (phosphoserine phosphatase)